MNDKPNNVVRLPQPSQALADSTTIARCEPATRSQGIAELGACLTLVSPSGLSAEDRKEWLAVAMKTLSGIPADLLQMGCEYARLHCKFPSEIVPTIMERVGKAWKWRKDDAARAAEAAMPRQLPAPRDCVDPKLIRDLIRSIGHG